MTRAAILTVTENQPPQIAVSPASGTQFIAGQRIPFSATATDPEEGELSSDSFLWRVKRIDPTGQITDLGTLSGVAEGTFIPPNSGSFDPVSYYQISLSAADSRGLTNTRSIELFPQERTLIFQTSPAGMSLFFDGVERPTPFEIKTAAGFTHQFAAPQEISRDGETFLFSDWEDSDLSARQITVTTNASFTARYSVQQPAVVSLLSSSSSLTVGSHVLFGVQTSGAGPFEFTWDFGDGSAGAGGSSMSHAYAAAGQYLLAVSIKNKFGATETATLLVNISENGGGGSDSDSDGDGVDDAVEAEDGTSPHDPASFKIRPLTVASFSAQLDSTKANNDRLSLKGTLPEALEFKNATLQVSISAFQTQFNLAPKGKGSAEIGKCALQSSTSRKSGSSVKLNLSLSKASLGEIAPAGTAAQPLLLPVTVRLCGKVFSATVSAQGLTKSGKTRLKK